MNLVGDEDIVLVAERPWVLKMERSRAVVGNNVPTAGVAYVLLDVLVPICADGRGTYNEDVAGAHHLRSMDRLDGLAKAGLVPIGGMVARGQEVTSDHLKGKERFSHLCFTG